MADFGVRFRILRRESGLSQQKVAEMLGVSQSTIAAWETGRSSPDIDTAEKAAEALGVTLAHFFGDRAPHKTYTDAAYEVLDILTSDKDDKPRSLYSRATSELAHLDEVQLSHALVFIQFLRSQKPSTD